MLDSASIVQIGQIAGTVATNVANQTGHTDISGLIQTVVGAVCAVVIYVLGHWRGTKAAKKA